MTDKTADLFLGREIPKARGLIGGGREEISPVFGGAQREDRLFMPGQLRDRGLVAFGGEVLLFIVVRSGGLFLRLFLGFPLHRRLAEHFDLVVAAGGQELFPVGGKGQIVESPLSGIVLPLPRRFAGIGVPEVNQSVVTGRRHDRAGGVKLHRPESIGRAGIASRRFFGVFPLQDGPVVAGGQKTAPIRIGRDRGDPLPMPANRLDIFVFTDPFGERHFHISAELTGLLIEQFPQLRGLINGSRYAVRPLMVHHQVGDRPLVTPIGEIGLRDFLHLDLDRLRLRRLGGGVSLLGGGLRTGLLLNRHLFFRRVGVNLSARSVGPGDLRGRLLLLRGVRIHLGGRSRGRGRRGAAAQRSVDRIHRRRGARVRLSAGAGKPNKHKQRGQAQQRKRSDVTTAAFGHRTKTSRKTFIMVRKIDSPASCTLTNSIFPTGGISILPTRKFVAGQTRASPAEPLSFKGNPPLSAGQTPGRGGIILNVF